MSLYVILYIPMAFIVLKCHYAPASYNHHVPSCGRQDSKVALNFPVPWSTQPIQSPPPEHGWIP